MKKLLLIEPHYGLGNQARSWFEKHDYRVSWAQNAQDAINLADTHRPDVVVLEPLLAGHSGVEFLHEFRSYSEWLLVPVILFSRLHPRQLSLNQTLLDELGVKHYLYKPTTSLKKLTNYVERVTPRTLPA